MLRRREGVSDTVQQREREERTREMKKDHRGSRASKPPPATDEEQTVLNHSTILPERPLKGAACKHTLYRTHVTNNSDNEILKAVSVRDAVAKGVLPGGDGWRHFF